VDAVARGEMVEAELTRIIEKRARNGEEDPDEQDPGYIERPGKRGTLSGSSTTSVCAGYTPSSPGSTNRKRRGFAKPETNHNRKEQHRDAELPQPAGPHWLQIYGSQVHGPPRRGARQAAGGGVGGGGYSANERLSRD
jgi:hypothetical protein